MKRQITFLLALVCASCAGAPKAVEDNGVIPMLSGLEMAPVNFKRGAPEVGESLLSAIDGEFAKQSLERNLMIVKKYDDLRFEILGFTDSEECLARACKELSARRARSVQEWLVENGAKPSSFVRVEGLGAEMPIADTSTVEGRATNRRVEVNQLIRSN